MIRHASLHEDNVLCLLLLIHLTKQLKCTEASLSRMTSQAYASMNQTDEQLFADEQIQRYDAETIKRRYGEHWRNYASNVREIKQADGSIIRGREKNK